MYKERKVYVSKNNKLRAEIIRLYHDTLVGKHEGYNGIGHQKLLVARSYKVPKKP